LSYLSESELVARRGELRRRAKRRRRLATLALIATLAAVGIVAIMLGGSSKDATRQSANGAASAPTPASAAPAPGANATHPASAAPAHLPPIKPAAPGVARVVSHGPSRPEIALTIDDGFCAQCVARIIHTLAATGAHATIFPNGVYGRSWEPQAAAIRRLVAAGQLTVGNHTFLHHDAQLESADAFGTDLGNDERWIEKTFGVTARPFFRPPYGAYNSSTLQVAGSQGYTKVLIWSGTVADSSPRTVGYILGAIRHWARPGAIILMHGNYPATSIALPQILEILRARGLRAVTLAEMLGHGQSA
jgi:peptidoglycan/xylan/chitin deacetylase (PgdA/CDA1 family)